MNYWYKAAGTVLAGCPVCALAQDAQFASAEELRGMQHNFEWHERHKIVWGANYRQLARHVNEHVELAVAGENLLDDRHPEFPVGALRPEVQRAVREEVYIAFLS